MTYRASDETWHLGAGDVIWLPRGPGADGLAMDVEIARWNEVGPRFGLQVVGPPLPEDA